MFLWFNVIRCGILMVDKTFWNYVKWIKKNPHSHIGCIRYADGVCQKKLVDEKIDFFVHDAWSEGNILYVASIVYYLPTKFLVLQWNY